MTNLYHQLLQLLARCRDAVAAIQPRGGAFDHPSQKTRADYLRLGKTLLHRARYAEHGLRDVLINTTSPRTFQKRMAALRYFLHVRQRELMASVHQASDEQLQSLQPELEQQLQAAGHPLPFQYAPGGHTWHYWQALMPQIMPTLARQLQPAPLP